MDIFKFSKNKINKTKFGSYCMNNVAEGCKFCINGRKLVLFITGKCATNCIYCPLSKLRKNSDKVWANERICDSFEDVLKEAKESNATSAGITGGDPLLVLDKTIEYAEKLKETFGKDFHIHIYLSTKLVTKENLEKLSKVIDEVRFHPDFLSENIEKEVEKIGYAKEFFKKENIGIEIPLFPDEKDKALKFIEKVSGEISFVNLNELEIGDSNFDYISEKYTMNEGGYTIKNSLNSGVWILNQCLAKQLDLNVHLCTAETKNWHQYKNRLLNHNILPHGERTEEGTVIYYVITKEKNNNFEELKKEIKDAYFDETKERIIIDEKDINRYSRKCTITKSEEYPTFDRIEVESYDL